MYVFLVCASVTLINITYLLITHVKYSLSKIFDKVQMRATIQSLVIPGIRNICVITTQNLGIH